MKSGRERELCLVRRAHPVRLLCVAVTLLLLLLAVGAVGVSAAPAVEGAQPTANSRVYLPILQGSGTPAGRPSSDDLIDAAIAKGEISAETGLVYKVFAAFGDPRLPAKYTGDDSKPHEAPWLRQAAAQWPQLSKVARDTLAPFIQPPIYVQSWYGQRQSGVAGSSPDSVAPDDVPTPLPGGAWKNVVLAGGKARIWWNTDIPGSTQAVAQHVSEVLGGRVWPMLTTYMNKLPLDDKGPHVFTDLNGDEQVWGDGEDGAVDVYIIPGIGHGGAMTVGYPPGCTNIPAFMIVDPGMGNFEAAMAHEFMHVLQFAYKSLSECNDLAWLSESTAHWAIDYAYSSNNYEHGSVQMLYSSYRALDDLDYHAWVFWWQLDRTLGLSQAVRTAWEKTEQFPKTLAAVNAALPGGFATQWHKVALHNLNRLTYNELSRLDQFSETAHLTMDMDLPLNAEPHKTYQLSVNLHPPAAQYYHFTTDDETISTLSFMNPYTADKFPNVHVQALVHIQGRSAWEPVEDWTGRGRSFCRDVRAERIDELYIVISNDRWQDPRPALETPTPTIELTNIACRGWEGEVTYKSWYIDEIEPGVVLSEINQDFWTGTTFMLQPRPDWLTGPGSALYFEVDPATEVSINEWGWWLDGHDPPIKCNYLVDDVAPVLPQRNSLIIFADATRAYGAEGEIAVVDLPGTDSCEGKIIAHYDHPNWWLTGDGTNAAELVVSSDGTHITGKWEKYRTPTSWATFEWMFTALLPE